MFILCETILVIEKTGITRILFCCVCVTVCVFCCCCFLQVLFWLSQRRIIVKIERSMDTITNNSHFVTNLQTALQTNLQKAVIYNGHSAVSLNEDITLLSMDLLQCRGFSHTLLNKTISEFVN